jgi:acyl-CoA dehydrogenase
MGDILITSAPYLDPSEGWQVFHFPVPFTADGLKILPDWKSMGMRGTGSNSVVLENVFVPEESISLKRPRGVFHPVFSVIATVACPIIVSVYVGAAEAAAGIAREQARRRAKDPVLPYLLGEMENHLATAQMAWESLLAIANDFDFAPGAEITSTVLIRKTLAVNSALATAEKALESMGGSGYYRAARLERLLRDLHAGQFHPLPEKRQQLFTGRLALGLDPVEPETYPLEA